MVTEIGKPQCPQCKIVSFIRITPKVPPKNPVLLCTRCTGSWLEDDGILYSVECPHEWTITWEGSEWLRGCEHCQRLEVKTDGQWEEAQWKKSPCSQTQSNAF